MLCEARPSFRESDCRLQFNRRSGFLASLVAWVVWSITMPLIAETRCNGGSEGSSEPLGMRSCAPITDTEHSEHMPAGDERKARCQSPLQIVISWRAGIDSEGRAESVFLSATVTGWDGWRRDQTLASPLLQNPYGL